MTPQSVFSSSEEPSIVRATVSAAPSSSSGLSSLVTKPRVTISGLLSSFPVWRFSATIGTITPNSDKWRRSRITTSSRISSPVPESIHTRPTGTDSRCRAPSESISSTSPLSSRNDASRPLLFKCSLNCKWRESCRYSPCTGTKYFGRSKLSTNFSSSSLA